MTPSNLTPPPFNTDSYLIAEYTALREELRKNLDAEIQTISLTIVASATFISVGLQKGINSTVLLIYPMFSMLLALRVRENIRQVNLIGYYIRVKYEKYLSDFGWETFIMSFKGHHYLSGGNFARRGLFSLTQVLSVGLWFINPDFGIGQLVLLAVDTVCFVITLFVILQSQRKAINNISPIN